MPKEIIFSSFDDQHRKLLQSLFSVLTIKSKKAEKDSPAQYLLKEKFQKNPYILKLKTLVEEILNGTTDYISKRHQILDLIKEIRAFPGKKDNVLHAALTDILKAPAASMYVFFSTLHFPENPKEHLENFEKIVSKLLSIRESFSAEFNFQILVFTSYEEIFREKGYEEDQIEEMQAHIFSRLSGIATKILGKECSDQTVHWSKTYRDQIASFGLKDNNFSLKDKIGKSNYSAFEANVQQFIAKFAIRAFGVSPFKGQPSIDPNHYKEGQKRNILIGGLTELEILHLFVNQTILEKDPSRKPHSRSIYFAHIGAMKEVATVLKMLYPKENTFFVDIQVNGKNRHFLPKKSKDAALEKAEEKTIDFSSHTDSPDRWVSATPLELISPQTSSQIAGESPLIAEEKTIDSSSNTHSPDRWVSATPLELITSQITGRSPLLSANPLEIIDPKKSSPKVCASAPARFFSQPREHAYNHVFSRAAKIIDQFELITDGSYTLS